MTYSATLDYLYAQLPMYHRVGAAAYKNDLTNTLALCEHLGNPHQRFASIHVGGTNGKGSVSHMLAALCQARGLKTGLYVSPHYKDFRERIKINGQYIPRKRVTDFVTQHQVRIEEIQPSFFELTVALAFDFFATEQVDIAIIEVGLGGRLDSTNVIAPLLSVITNISYDHMNLLGDTLPLIAAEKAGIIKPGIPVVIGETHPESAPVFLKKATEVAAPIVFADQHFQADERGQRNWESTIYDVFKDQAPYILGLEVQAAGPFQAKNVATVLQAWEWVAPNLPHVNPTPGPSRINLTPDPSPNGEGRRDVFRDSVYISPPLSIWRGVGGEVDTGGAGGGVEAALSRLRSFTRFMGRWQVIGHHPTVLCDSAHNEAGIRLAFEKIGQILAPLQGERTPHLPPPFGEGPGVRFLHIVTGFVNDKDVDNILRLFPTTARYYFAKAKIPRGLDAAALRDQAARHGLRGRAYVSVKNALRAARHRAGPDDLVVVIGSVFVVAEVLP